MVITEWNLADNIKTKEDLFLYMESALEEKDLEYLIIACKDVVKIAKDKGFYTEKDVRKLWYKKNKAKVLKQSKKWHDAHKEYGKEYGKKYRVENAEKCKKLQAEWRKNNKDKRAEYFHRWYMKKKNKTETRPYNKKEK